MITKDELLQQQLETLEQDGPGQLVAGQDEHDLVPLLTVARMIRSVAHPEMAPAAVQNQRQQILAARDEIGSNTTPASRIWSRWQFPRLRLAGGLALLLLIAVASWVLSLGNMMGSQGTDTLQPQPAFSLTNEPTTVMTPTTTLIPIQTITNPATSRPTGSSACAEAAPHPDGVRLAEQYNVSYEVIMAWFCGGFGFGEIEIAYTLSRETGTAVETIFDLRADGLGWGNIMQQLGILPGGGSSPTDEPVDNPSPPDSPPPPPDGYPSPPSPPGGDPPPPPPGPPGGDPPPPPPGPPGGDPPPPPPTPPAGDPPPPPPTPPAGDPPPPPGPPGGDPPPPPPGPPGGDPPPPPPGPPGGDPPPPPPTPPAGDPPPPPGPPGGDPPPPPGPP